MRDIETAARQIGIDAAQAYNGQDPFDVAHRLGVPVDWTDADHVVAGLRLRAEYDHDNHRITLYRRGLAEFAASGPLERIASTAVAHELFHHLACTDSTIASALHALSRPARRNIEEFAANAFSEEWQPPI